MDSFDGRNVPATRDLFYSHTHTHTHRAHHQSKKKPPWVEESSSVNENLCYPMYSPITEQKRSWCITQTHRRTDIEQSQVKERNRRTAPVNGTMIPFSSFGSKAKTSCIIPYLCRDGRLRENLFLFYFFPVMCAPAVTRGTQLPRPLSLQHKEITTLLQCSLILKEEPKQKKREKKARRGRDAGPFFVMHRCSPGKARRIEKRSFF